jgi:hypothetical protein
MIENESYAMMVFEVSNVNFCNGKSYHSSSLAFSTTGTLWTQHKTVVMGRERSRRAFVVWFDLVWFGLRISSKGTEHRDNTTYMN